MAFFSFKDISGFSMQSALQSATQSTQALMFAPTINTITGSPNSGPETRTELTSTQAPRQEPKVDQVMPVFSPGSVASAGAPISDIAGQFPTSGEGGITQAGMFDKKTLIIMMVAGGAMILLFPKKKK